MMMMSGAALASVQAGRTPMETLKNIPVNIRETRPTILLSVPALAKNFRKNIEKGVREKGNEGRGAVRAGPRDGLRVQRGRVEPRGGQAHPEAALARALRRAHLPQDPRELRRPPAVHHRRRSPARHRVAALLLRDRHPDAAGVRADRGGAGHLGQHPRAPQARVVGPDHARPGGPHLRRGRPPAAGRHARRDRRPRRERDGRLLEERERPPPRCCATAGSTRATSATWTRTGSSTSSAA